ncbi:MAG TPA: serine hydrolase [Gaiellaceae bacterium]|nr:serine hydrolase [Gaiellaceae bacterium]
MSGRLGRVAAALVVALALVPSAEAAGWQGRRGDAVDYLARRAGVESFALVDARGHIHAYRRRLRAPSASLLKAMLLVAYLDRPDVRHRDLRRRDRNLLGPMIRRSDNVAAGTVLGIVGSSAVHRVARRARMRDFSLRSPWGLSTTSASDQARFFYRIDRLVTARHRAYAMRLLARIVPSQRWGIPPVVPDGWRIHFKGGWGSGTGRVTHQSALLRRSGERMSLSILTQWNPSHHYGTTTIRGIAARLLRAPLPPAPQ